MIIEFNSNDDERPLYYGSYICFPTCIYEDLKYITDNYTLEDTNLINITENTLFNRSYFVLEVTGIKDPTLYDFDFNTNTNDLLNKLNIRDKTAMNVFLQNNADSYNFNIIQNIVSTMKNNSPSYSLYNKLSPDHKKWFGETFPQLSSALNLPQNN